MHKGKKMICKHCGKEFISTKIAQKYCSPECRRKANKKKAMGVREFTCEWCGLKFMSDRARKYCCDKCRDNAHNDRWHKKKTPKIKNKPKLSIEEVAALAKEEGLTYGQYCAKHGLY